MEEEVVVNNSKCARWIFTCNNPGDFEFKSLWRPEDMLYLCGQKEKAPTTGTEHFHAYIVFKTRKAFKTIKAWAKKIFPTEPDIEPCKGNEQQNKAYVTKADERIDGPWEFGTYDATRGVQGKRTDLDDVYHMIKTGSTFPQIAEAHPSDAMRYHSGIHDLMIECADPPPVQREVKVMVLWGATGTGKTHRVLMKYPNCYQVLPGRDPWGNYHGEKEVLFDEFDPNGWTVQQMNQYLDKWRCKLPARYHDRYAMWDRVFIISNNDPAHWFPMASAELIASFNRRIGLIEGGNGQVIPIMSKNQDVPELNATVVDALHGTVQRVATVELHSPDILLDSNGSPLAVEMDDEADEDQPPPLKRTKKGGPIVIDD